MSLIFVLKCSLFQRFVWRGAFARLACVHHSASMRAATDIPYPNGATPPNVEIHPIAATMVCPVYNLNVFGQNDDSSLSDVILPVETIARIFRGNITNWDDDAILEHNSHLRHRVRGKKIRLVARGDPSGTTMIFTSALSTFDAIFRDEVGSGSRVTWPSNTTLRELSQGVLNDVLKAEFSLGYLAVTLLSRYVQKWVCVLSVFPVSGITYCAHVPL
jgi:ABC-type phosphate transport system substrate-binding protein